MAPSTQGAPGPCSRTWCQAGGPEGRVARRWGRAAHSQLLVVGIVQCRPLVLLMRLPLDGLVIGVQVGATEAVIVLQETWTGGMLGGPGAPTPNQKGRPRPVPAGQPHTWRGGTWWVPRWSLDPGDAERQGAGAGGEGALGRPRRGGGARRVCGQGCHGPGLLFDHSVQHLGIEGAGGRFGVLPLLGGVCGEPRGTEVCAMGGWLP